MSTACSLLPCKASSLRSPLPRYCTFSAFRVVPLGSLLPRYYTFFAFRVAPLGSFLPKQQVKHRKTTKFEGKAEKVAQKFGSKEIK